MNTQSPLIQAHEICKDYKKGRLRIPALRKLSLTVRQGEFVALMGPSGSGKSTLLNLLGGLAQVDQGSLRVNQIELAQLSDAQRTQWRSQNVGLVFQRYHLISMLSAAQNVELPLLLRNMGQAERQSRVANALELVTMSHRAQHLPSELSGGQEQRVSIARALVADAPLLLCDEPTGNLDAQSGAEILSILRALSRDFGKTIVMVTHNAEAARDADRVLTLADGVLLEGEMSLHQVAA